jgi:hypothetical protein
MSQARFTSAIRSAAGCDAEDAETAAAGSATTTDDDSDDVVTDRGQYMGLAEFAENVVRFNPCPQVDAQERSQTETEPAE